MSVKIDSYNIVINNNLKINISALDERLLKIYNIVYDVVIESKSCM